MRGDRLGRAVLNQYPTLLDDLPPLPPFGCEDLFIDRDGNPLPQRKKRSNAIRERVAICERSRDLPVGGTGSTHGWNDHKVSNPFHEVLNELTPFVWKCLYYWPVEELRRTFGITRDDLWSAGCEALWRAQQTWKRRGPFLTYARRCIRNAVVDLIRERNHTREDSLEKLQDENRDIGHSASLGSSRSDSPEAWLEYRAALNVIGLLPRHYHAVLVGQMIGLTDEELANQGFGSAAEAVKQTRKRSRAILPSLLK